MFHAARRATAAAVAALLLVTPARATWSILLIDTRTGEIAIASATCLTGFDLRRITPVLIVNLGAATAQASVNINSITNRALIWNLLMQGTPPPAILTALAAQDPGHQSRQYGIIDVTGGKVTFSGTSNSAFAGGVTGSIGTIHYAIQGNILTGQPVVAMAEQAVLNTPGDLPEKLMAAMEAAHKMGGDGRCSCNMGPTGCGSPPQNFTKSAHIGYMITARQGDTDGTCTSAAIGCATGTYWMNLNVAFQTAASPDPTVQLRGLFNTWRTTLAGRPDHHLSAVVLDPATLIPDGAASTTATLTLNDWQGTQLPSGGATVNVTLDPASTTTVAIGSVTDNGDGSYSFPITAGTSTGTAQLRIVVDDGNGPILLSPRTAVDVRADALWAASSGISAAAGGPLDLQLNAGGGAALRSYLVAATLSGTMPGLVVTPGLVIPLNHDLMFDLSLIHANSAVFVNTSGMLDMRGRARAQFMAPGGNLLAPLIGRDLHFAYALLFPLDFASNAVGVTIKP